VHAQRSLAVFTPSPYGLADQLILIEQKNPGKINLPAKEIEIVDNRFDNSKQGFYPVYKTAPKLIVFEQNLADWFHSYLAGIVNLNQPDTGRKLLFVIQRFWFSNSAEQKFTPFKQHLETSLLYKVEIFSHVGDSYFPLRRTEGIFKTGFTEHITYTTLVDSFFTVLLKDLQQIDYSAKETQKNSLAQQQVTNYVKKKSERLDIIRNLKRGVYESYSDFVQQKILGDSVELIKYNDYFERQIVACHIGVYVKNFLQSCNKCWGYFDGRYLFFNVGDGFFIKLTPWYDQFILADLQQVAYAKKKKPFVSEVEIANTSYDIIKDFAKAYHLFFQLDYADGKLY
jgi:hypothetical protein